jgi:membrane-bound lytic murein transglycosylase D
MIKFLLLSILLPVLISAASLADKYPVYTYVFDEFDVDESYIDNRSFVMFVQKNEHKIKQLYERAMQREEMLPPMLRGYLMEQGLSDLLIYLAVVESGLSTDSVSPKNAVGVWQFMPATAQAYHLDICNSFDERYDPVSSTSAAATYLNKLYQQFGKWYLAVIAYNCGEGRLKRAIAMAGSDDLEILTDDEAKYLPKETREYIRKILLASMIGEGTYLDFSVDFRRKERKVVQVEVHGGCSLTKIAKMIEMKPSVLFAMNRQFKKGMAPNEKGDYRLMIPEEKLIPFYLNYDVKEDEMLSKPNLLSHMVTMGDTLEHIARKYDSSVEAIKRVNKLSDEFLELGAVLLVPVSKETFEAALRSL